MRYNRTLFSYSSGKARSMIIERDSFAFDGSQMMLDNYNGMLIELTENWHAEHIFPLKSAWDAGFKQQYADDAEAARTNMRSFANNSKNLIPVMGYTNMSRGTRTLWNWSMLNLRYVPVRNKIVRELADEYGLTLTRPQLWAMDWSDQKILDKYSKGIQLSKVRSWLIQHGFHRVLMPFI